MVAETEKLTEEVSDIQKNTEVSAQLLAKFTDVFDTMNNTLMHQSRIMHELLRVNVDQIEIQRRRDQLESVSSDPSNTFNTNTTQLQQTSSRSHTDTPDFSDIGPSFMQGLMTNLLANLFSGGKGLLNGVKGMSIGGLVGKAFIAATVAPWAREFTEAFLSDALANTSLSEEDKALAAETGGKAVRNSIIGGALFGKKGAIIGGLGALIEGATIKLAKQMGKDLDEEVMNFGGFSITGNDAASVGGVAAAAGLVQGGPALARGAISLAIANPVAAAIAIGATAAAVGTQMARNNRANYDVTAEQFKGDFTQDTNDFARGVWGLGFNRDATNDGGSLAKFSSQVDEMVDSGLDDSEKSKIMQTLTDALKKANIELTNPNNLTGKMSASNAEEIAAILDAIGENDLAKKWRDEKIARLLTKNTTTMTIKEQGEQRFTNLDSLKYQYDAMNKKYARTNDPADLKKLEDLRMQIDEAKGKSNPSTGVPTSSYPAIIPGNPLAMRNDNINAVRDASTNQSTVVSVIRQGDNNTFVQGDSNVNARINQNAATNVTSPIMPGFDLGWASW